jgi:hypothetical protein
MFWQKGHRERRTTTATESRQGEVFKDSMNGVDFLVKKIVGKMVVLESQDNKRQILTEGRTLTLTSFCLKRTGEES